MLLACMMRFASRDTLSLRCRGDIERASCDSRRDILRVVHVSGSSPNVRKHASLRDGRLRTTTTMGFLVLVFFLYFLCSCQPSVYLLPRELP